MNRCRRLVAMLALTLAGLLTGASHAQSPIVALDPFALPQPRPASKGAYQYGIEMLRLDRAWILSKGRAHISMVDSGFVSHPELGSGLDGNFRTHLSQTNKAVGGFPNSYHATLVAGVLAARGFNGVGIAGACPWCTLTIHSGSATSPAGPIDVVAGTNAAVASGAAVINMSFGFPVETDPAKQQSCDNLAAYAGAAPCAAMRKAEERDLVMVAIAQNEGRAGLPFPANYPAVIAVGGVDSAGRFWDTGYDPQQPGSNYDARIRLVAPAKDVLTLQSPGKYLYDYVPYRCGDRVDAPTDMAPTLPATYSGYGDCTGTSFAAPFVAGIAGLIRSINPLLTAVEVRTLLTSTATQAVPGPAGSGLSFQLPDAEKAVQAALGTGVVNRSTPMFALYAADTQTHLFTTTPQTAVAGIAGEFKLDGQATASRFQSFGDPVAGYASFTGRICDAAGACTQPAARALFEVYTTDAAPDGQGVLTALYRMSQVCAAGSPGCKATRNFAYATDRDDVRALEGIGYVVDAVEGYVHPPLGPVPTGALRLCTARDAARIDTILYAAQACDRSRLTDAAGATTGGSYQTVGTLGWVRASSAPAPVNYTDLWYNAAESGWGIHITHHNQNLFGAWFTYDEQGNQLFVTMPGCNLVPFNGSTCRGDLYRTTGPSYRTLPFDPTRVVATKVGDATVTFTAQDTAIFSYSIGSVTLSKSIRRQPYGSAVRTNYPNDLSDHFYRSDASGWGVAVAEHGNKSFTVIYHYDADGRPMFVTLPDSQVQGSTQTGKLYRTRSKGSHYLSPTWNASDIEVTEVGNGTLQASQGGLSFQFTIDGFNQQHQLTRLPF